jgi:hypothetical protein
LVAKRKGALCALLCAARAAPFSPLQNLPFQIQNDTNKPKKPKVGIPGGNAEITLPLQEVRRGLVFSGGRRFFLRAQPGGGPFDFFDAHTYACTLPITTTRRPFLKNKRPKTP